MHKGIKKSQFTIQKIPKLFWNEFVYGGHLLSFSAASIVLAVLILVNKTSQILPLIFITYLIPQIVFNLDHIKFKDNDLITNPERVDFLEKDQRKNLNLLVIYIIVLIFMLIFFANLGTLIYIIILVLAGILYPKNLTKRILGFKNIYTAILFKSIIFLPMVFFSLSNYVFFILFFIFGLIRGIVNTTFFDIKDIISDKKENLKTLPVVLGKRKTIKILSIVNFLSIIPLFIGIYYKIFSIYSLILSVFVFYSFIYLYLGRKVNDKSLRAISYIMVDGEYYFWPIMLLIAKLILE